MTIFNSLGSNYTFSSAIRMLFSSGGARKDLIDYLEKRYGGRAILTYKGREALMLALKALPEKGAVAVNGFTCYAVFEAITESGHTPHYLDITEDSLDFSAETLRQALARDPSIKAVIVQNTLGIPCDIAAISGSCAERGVPLIEDLAHSIGARYTTGEEAGTVGDFVILSFSQDKVVDAVSGGALIIRNEKFSGIPLPTKKIPLGQQIKDRLYPIVTWKIRIAYGIGIGKVFHAIVRKLHILSSPFGTDASVAHELPDWYCGNILRQYRALDETANHRKAIAEIYAKKLDAALVIKIITEHSANLRFPVFSKHRGALIDNLRTYGVHVSDIWYDAPVAPRKYMHRTDYRSGTCPNAEKLSETILNLPTHLNVSPEQARRIAGLVNEFLARSGTYEIRAMRDEPQWEAFVQARHPHSFLHSWTWGEQYATTGSNIFRLGAYRNGTLVGVALLIKIAARRGSFLLCPHGPTIADTANEKEVLRAIVDEATRIAKREHCAFIRFCPLAEASGENVAIYRDMGFRNAPIHMHPELSWMLDLSKPEEQLLKDMRKTTRYLIKKMEKEGVEITTSTDPDDIEKFWPVYQATVQRQQFTPFKKGDLRTEFELFAARWRAAFFFGEHGGKVVAAAIIIFYNGQAFYHHSGSLSSGSNVSYLLQWRVIREAKRRGCTLYNFWGVSPADRPKHPWAGLSQFKKGFGGSAEEYLHAQDKPLSAKYWLNYIVETIRRIRRGL